ncbi:DUF1330 domain-containing protein [Pontibaca methylaminivorans]|uniref:Uncharacterized conserved protein, DUF1330 family n=1 Tax=Pontibaca methylaminivorans TaxID=515897 RepID=A0A1R3WMZ3_9RHOB|nr:DUF1330 domain-containing protein [Pontibaca methylaminivorans]SIT77983.1 Uncharacterized conserved protein, DUF1330 family [Pontibaca methylaminivorans]
MGALWISQVSVSNEAPYREYARLAVEAIAAHGGEFVVRGGRYVQLEGQERPRHVVVRFPDLETAEACYRSDLYQQALSHARGASERDLVIVETAD